MNLGGRHVDTWSYGAEAVGPEIRISKGDRLNLRLQNDLSSETSVHWHGIAIRNDMDGVPPITQERIQPGAEFTYDFVAPDHGTYWYHSHSGLQADRGLFGALVVEDPNDRTGADEDVVIVIDDWLDGLGTTPDAVLRALSPEVQGGHHGHGGPPPEIDEAEIDSAAQLLEDGHGSSTALGGMATHITYPLHLINGRPAEDPFVVSAPAGTRLRLRVINAGAETPYRFSVAGHELTVVSADGQDVSYAVGDEILIAPAQRYDVLVTVQSGSWPIAAKVEGKTGGAACLLRTPDSVAFDEESRMSVRTGLTTLIAVAAVFTLTSCGSDSTGSTEQTPVEISVKNLAYTPNSVTVHTGQTVTWIFEDQGMPHDVVFAELGTKSDLQGSGTYSQTFDKAGTFTYTCTPHPNMTGTIIVEE